MSFFNNTSEWIKGELLEASMILFFGLLTLSISLLFWKIGTTPNAKALFLPLLVVSLVYTAIGGGMLVSNKKRMVELPKVYSKNQTAFIQAEKKRVEDFQYGYTISKIVASVCFPLTLLIFWYSKNPTLLGIGIGLSYFVIAGLVIDYFSQERALVYYKAILVALK